MSDQNSLVLKGKITHIGETKEVSDSFKKRELWLKDLEEDYAQEHNIEFLQDKVSLLDKYAVGDIVTIDINLRGKRTNDETRVFNQLNGWRIAGTASGAAPSNDVAPEPESKDDLPF